MSAPAGQNQNNADASGAHGAASSEPDVLEVLTGFQASVENLKSLYAHRPAVGAKLAEREAELAAHAERLKLLENEFEERRVAAARDKEALEQLHQQTEKRAEELAVRIAEADRTREDVERSRAEAQKHQAEIERTRAEVEKARADIERTRSEVEKSRADADRAKSDGDRSRAEVEKARVEAEKAKSEAERTRAEIEKTRADAEKAKAEAERSRAEVEKIRAEVESAKAAVEKARAEAEAARADATGLAEDLHAQQAEIEAARKSIEAQRQAVAASAAEVAAREVSFKTRAVEREASASRAGEFEKQLKESRAALAAEQARARECENALRAELAGAVKTRDDLASRATSGSDQEQRLRSELEAATRKCASLQSVAEDHARQLAAEREESKRLSLEVSAMSSAGKQSQSSSDADRAKLEKAARALVELRSERDAIRSQLSKAQHDLARALENASKGKPAMPRDAAVELRRRRVSRYRDLLKEQSEKVKKATDTLKSRFEAAEQLVSQRAELAEAHAAVKAAERRNEKSKSKGRVAATMFYGIASALVLAFMCWIGTGWFTPGDFIATAIIGAESRTRELSDAERAEWQAFHEQILADPQFHETVAERLQRRAITDYASPGAVRDLIKQHLQTRSAEDGQLVLEMRGPGSDRTARLLDTVTTALASQANSSRHKRVDGASTIVKQNSTPSDQPADNQRLVYAALSWAVSLMLGLAVAAILWRRMLHAKSTFERATRVDEILDETRWQPLPTAATGRKGRGKMSF